MKVMQAHSRGAAYPHFSRLALASLISIVFCLSIRTAMSAQAILAGDKITTDRGDVIVHPINHATLALQWNGVTFYVDPVGGADRFRGLPEPDFVLVTHSHGDHLHAETLRAVTVAKTKLIVSADVRPLLPSALAPQAIVLANGQVKAFDALKIKIEAVAAYNLSPDRLKFHAKGRGNGYLLSLDGQRIYLSGDTEDTEEMKQLRDIQVAFVCVNLPYTMDPEQAARAVKAFKPKVVYPYHCRGSDLDKFKALLKDEPGIEVRLRDWYATK